MIPARVILSVLLAVATASAGEGAGRLRKDRPASEDPALRMDPFQPLSPADERRVRELFDRLAADDFDAREIARRDLLAFGPRALSVARLFETHADPEIREFARTMSDSVLVKYRGYMPTAPGLDLLLNETHRVFIGKQERWEDALQRFIRSTGLRVHREDRERIDLVLGTAITVETTTTIRESLKKFAKAGNVVAVPRGDAVVIASTETARDVLRQEHRFTAAEWNFPAADAPRLAETLKRWLPDFGEVEESSEVVADGDAIVVRGREFELRLAARAIHLLTARSATVFPLVPDAAKAAEYYALLARPAKLSVAAPAPRFAILRLKEDGQPLEFDGKNSGDHMTGTVLRLELGEAPLGFCLAWIGDRITPPLNRFTAVEPLRLEIAPELENGRIRTSLILERQFPTISETVGAADLSFAKAASDREALKAFSAACDDELSLYPCDVRDWGAAVFDSWLVVRGPAPRVARALRLIEEWRSKGRPAIPAWRAEVERRLDATVKWDGSVLTPDTLLPHLKDVTGLNIVLETGPGFQPVRLMVDAKGAELLPKGEHTARALIQKLSEVAGAHAIVRWGAIMLSPAQKKEE